MIPYELFPMGYTMTAIFIAFTVGSLFVGLWANRWNLSRKIDKVTIIFCGLFALLTIVIAASVILPTLYTKQITVCSHDEDRILGEDGVIYYVWDSDKMLFVNDGCTITATLAEGWSPNPSTYIYRIEKPTPLRCRNQSGC